MKKLILGAVSAIAVSFMLCGCGASVEMDPNMTASPDAATHTPSGQSNGLTQSDGMQ